MVILGQIMEGAGESVPSDKVVIFQGRNEMSKKSFLLVVAIYLLIPSLAAAESSKFTAKAGTIGVAPASTAQLAADFPGVSTDLPTWDAYAQYRQEGWFNILGNQIKTANPSDLIVDVSLECGIVTDTLVKSKGGNRETSSAEAGVMIKVLVDGNEMDPGEVTFCRRYQELSATFQGLLENDLGETCLSADPDTGVITIDEECMDPEEIELVLKTMNANSFNFLATDLGPGMHDVVVFAKIESGTNQTTESGTNSDSTVDAYALLGKGSVAIEEVKMIKAEDVTNTQ